RAQTTDTTATALFLRPDGRVAWATGSPPDAGSIAECRAALTRWAGVSEPGASAAVAKTVADRTA
ncbi:MAG: hypothetical protein HOQ36_14655, partial [Nocardia sp.]|nr:hypothetical protein [Nocardia sp.]